MKKPRFTDEQMVTILREADAKPVPDVAKKDGVRAQTIYSWRKHCGSLEPSDVTRVRQLEQENGRLKKMVADRDLEIDVLKEITRKNGRRTRAPAAGRVDPITRAVRPPRVRRALGRAIAVGLPGAAGGAGRLRRGRDAPPGGPVSPRRVSPESPLLETGGTRDEPRSDASALAPRRVAGPPAARGLGTAPAVAADRPAPRVGVRLRVRYLRDPADAQMPDDCRRVDARMPGDRRGRRHPRRSGDRGARAARQRARRAAGPAVGPRATSEVKEAELL